MIQMQIKFFSMRGSLLVKTNFLSTLHVVHYSCLVRINSLNSTYVRMCMSRRKYAWLENKRLFSTHQRLNKEHFNGKPLNRASFEQWLVGFTDGDGNFHISHQGTGTSTKWTLGYKLTQSGYNLRILNYIKKELKVGSITKDGTKVQYFIRDRKILETILIPIFDKYPPLLTTKHHSYLLVKKFLHIYHNSNLTMEQKNVEFAKLYLESKGVLGRSPDISYLTNSTHAEIKARIYNWLIGFIESQNVFFLHTNNEKYFIRFSLVFREPNILLLQLIKRLLHISNTIYSTSNSYYVLTTSNSRSILNIVNYFKDQFKGMRSLEFKLWSKANLYINTNLKKVYKIDKILRRLENKNSTNAHLYKAGSLSSHEVRSIIDGSIYSSSLNKAFKRESCHSSLTPYVWLILYLINLI